MTDLVRVWIIPVDLGPEATASCRSVLDHGERARAAAFVSARDEQRFVIGHGALRILAARELGTRPAGLAWTPGAHGKPELAPPWSGVHTSLSHSAELIAAAFSAQPAGRRRHPAPGPGPGGGRAVGPVLSAAGGSVCGRGPGCGHPG